MCVFLQLQSPRVHACWRLALRVQCNVVACNNNKRWQNKNNINLHTMWIGKSGLLLLIFFSKKRKKRRKNQWHTFRPDETVHFSVAIVKVLWLVFSVRWSLRRSPRSSVNTCMWQCCHQIERQQTHDNYFEVCFIVELKPSLFVFDTQRNSFYPNNFAISTFFPSVNITNVTWQNVDS